MAAQHAEWLDVDVYQVGHHGSRSSTTPALLAAVSPQIGGISPEPATRTVILILRSSTARRPLACRCSTPTCHGTVVLSTAGDGTWSVSAEPVETNAEPQVEAATGDGPVTVAFVSVRSPVAPRGRADATVATVPGAVCEITVTYRSGPSSTRDLSPKTAEGDGTVSWTWTVESNTTPGEWPIDVTCTAVGQTATAQTTFWVSR
jgi:hypothetical protein